MTLPNGSYVQNQYKIRCRNTGFSLTGDRIWAMLTKYSRNFWFQLCQIALENFPNDLQFDLVIAMNNDISCSNHWWPGDQVIFILEGIRDFVGCFPNNYEIVQNGILGFIIRDELFIARDSIGFNGSIAASISSSLDLSFTGRLH